MPAPTSKCSAAQGGRCATWRPTSTRCTISWTIVERRLQDPPVPENWINRRTSGSCSAPCKGAAGLVASLRGRPPASRSGPNGRMTPSSAAIRHRRRRCTAGCRDGGEGFAIDPAIAADAVDEFLEFSTPSGRMTPSLDGTVHVHPTDAEGWMVPERDDGSLAIGAGPRQGRCAALRPPHPILLLILYRQVPSTARYSGTGTVLERLVAQTDLN